MTTPDALAVVSEAIAPSLALQSLDALERILDTVDALIDDLDEHVPNIRRRRSFMGGRWVTGLSVGGGLTGRTAFSRLDIEIGLADGGRKTDFVIRSTVRDEDQYRSTFEATLDDAGWVAVEERLQAEFLSFAERWFGAR
jgi:hypothetical protein